MENKKLLSSLLAASVKKIADSMLGDIIKIEKQRQKVADEQRKLEEMESVIKDTDELIKKKTGGYSYEKLFVVRKVKTGEKDGKETFANRTMWRYPETYLPTIADDYEEMANLAEEAKGETATEDITKVEENNDADILDVQL